MPKEVGLKDRNLERRELERSRPKKFSVSCFLEELAKTKGAAAQGKTKKPGIKQQLEDEELGREFQNHQNHMLLRR